MADRFFVEDTVALKADPTIIAIVEHTWRDTDSVGFSRPYDWIPHSGVSSILRRKCLREGRAPSGHVIIRFIDPYAGCALVKESALILKDRGLVVGDVVKRKASDAESGYVVKTSSECTLQPVYTDLPYHGSTVWLHKPEDNEIRVPAEEVTFIDYEVGHYVLCKGWVGEINDIVEEVTIRLSNGSVVRVQEAEELQVGEYQPPIEDEKATKRSLIRSLKEACEHLQEPTGKGHTGPADLFYPGQVVFTKKANLRLGNWVIGSYSPSQQPRGVVVEVRVISMSVDWLSCDIFNTFNPAPNAPPDTIDTDELDSVRLYNKNNVTPANPGESSEFGARQSHDVGVGDFVKFRYTEDAALKYSENSPNYEKTGAFRRIPREITQGFDMNVFAVRDTKQTVKVQWQDGSITEQHSIDVMPYLNVDEHDLWVGEICSLKSAETKEAGSVELGQVGVVQSVNAIERTAMIRWYESPKISVYEDRTTELEPGGDLGAISDRISQVSMYEVVAYPALTKRRGDLVLIAPNKEAQAFIEGRADTSGFFRATETEGTGNHQNGNRWFGEVVDLGKDGMLTVRLGALDQVEDVRVPVTMLFVLVGGDDEDAFSDENFNDIQGDSSTDDGDDYTSETEIIEETIIYEGGQRLDDGNEDTWMTDDEDGDEGDEEDEEDEEDGEVSEGQENGSTTAGNRSTNTVSHKDQDTEMIDLMLAPIESQKPKTVEKHKEYDFSSYSNTPTQFEILDEPAPTDQFFLANEVVLTSALLRRVRKEHSILSSSLPAGIWVRTWAERLDLLRIVIVGPRNTPYELAPFVLDFHLSGDFPISPPRVHFHSWTFGVGRINPNLYEDGKVCLSILGTWPEHEQGEGWDKEKSSVLQVIVSLMGLVLVEQPYYNEAGFESLVGTEETLFASKFYAEKAFCMSKGFVAYALSHKVASLEDILKWLYLDKAGPLLLKLVVDESRAMMRRGKGEEGERQESSDRLSAGAEILLKKHMGFLETRLDGLGLE